MIHISRITSPTCFLRNVFPLKFRTDTNHQVQTSEVCEVSHRPEGLSFQFKASPRSADGWTGWCFPQTQTGPQALTQKPQSSAGFAALVKGGVGLRDWEDTQTGCQHLRLTIGLWVHGLLPHFANGGASPIGKGVCYLRMLGERRLLSEGASPVRTGTACACLVHCSISTA